MNLAFTKMHGAANDFVVIDHREPFLPADRSALVARLADRRRGIGADGVLLLERDTDTDFAFVYYNADGGEAEFCGNGARCLARFALDLGLGSGDRVRFRTAVGEKSASRLADGRIALEFGPVGEPERIRVPVADREFAGSFILAGVPHFVVPVPCVADVPLEAWAPPLRAHARFGAQGANVEFVTEGLRVSAGETLAGIDFDLHDVGELTPVIAAICALASTKSLLRGIGHLRLHETDRLSALATEINRLGGKVIEGPDSLEIHPQPLHGGLFHTYDDHRLATAGALIGLVVPGVEIENIATTQKTIPDFVGLWSTMLEA